MSRRLFMPISLLLWVGGSLVLFHDWLPYCLSCFVGGGITAAAEHAIYGPR